MMDALIAGRVHGQPTARTGKNGKPWQAWFCPSSNRNDQCEAEWVR